MSVAFPNLRHLTLLCTVARLGSVSAAARAQHLSQPAVTQAIAALERHFATPLFARSAQGMEPTAAGRLAAARIERVLARLADSLAGAATASGAPAGALHAITAAQLQALLAVVDGSGFARAAHSAGVTRATLHRAARQLERAAGTALFERTSHGVRPTRAALRLARHVRLAGNELAQARAEVAATCGPERGVTVIGAMPLARSRIIPQAVLQFCARQPHHRISILDGPYENMLDHLRQGRADLLIGALRETTPADVVQEALFEDPLALIVRAGHPLLELTGGGRHAPTLEALRQFPWIAPRPGSPLRARFEQLFRGTGSPPEAPIECNSLVAARELLLASERVMLLSAQQAHHELAAGELVALAHPAGRVVREIGLTLRCDWRPTAAQSELLAIIRALARAHPSARRG